MLYTVAYKLFPTPKIMKYFINSNKQMDTHTHTNTYTHSTFEKPGMKYAKRKYPKIIKTPKIHKCTIYKFLVFLLPITSTITKKEEYQKSSILHKML